MAFLGDFFTNVIAGIFVELMKKIKVNQMINGVNSTRRYYAQLKSNLKSMPFIYKDLDSNVIEDYVDIEIRALDDSFRPKTTHTHLQANCMTILKNNRTVLFLGNAGVGKTTFQRHVILRIISRELKMTFLHTGERPVPVYIPLKAVDNTAPNPISRYLMEKLGLSPAKVIKYAKNKSLFLFLDGYDEIAFANPDKAELNYIQMELDILMGGRPERVPNILPEVEDFHTQLYGCRIWLSSRREFYDQNPIQLNSSSRTGQASSAHAVELKGVGQHRGALAKRIFDKYRARSERYNEVLDEECFLQEIDSSCDDDLRNLSYNPLFLTVMCYVYANLARDIIGKTTDKHSAVLFASSETAHQLIIECIRLLLRDLDEEKVRDLKWAKKKAFLNRRNSYIEEKFDFIKHLSFTLFLQERTLFDEEYLKCLAKEYFGGVGKRQTSDIIISELDTQKTSSPNLVRQLIYDGIFALVDKNSLGTYYDFPHRRFKEVMACEYITTPELYMMVLDVFDRAHLFEFMKVLKLSPVVYNETLNRQTLERILSNSTSNGKNATRMTAFFAEMLPNTINIKDILTRFLTMALSGYEEPAFEISRNLLNLLKTDTGLIATVEAVIINTINQGGTPRLALACDLSAFFNRQTDTTLLKSRLLEINCIDSRMALIECWCRVEPRSCVRELLFQASQLERWHLFRLFLYKPHLFKSIELDVIAMMSQLSDHDQMALSFIGQGKMKYEDEWPFTGSYLFTERDISDLSGLASKLFLAPEQTLSATLRKRLSEKTITVLTDYQNQSVGSDLLQETLLRDLNSIVEGESIFNIEQFKGISLRPETNMLLHRPQSVTSFWQNRLLIEDAYPQEIVKKSFVYVRDKEMMQALENVVLRTIELELASNFSEAKRVYFVDDLFIIKWQEYLLQQRNVVKIEAIIKGNDEPSDISRKTGLFIPGKEIDVVISTLNDLLWKPFLSEKDLIEVIQTKCILPVINVINSINYEKTSNNKTSIPIDFINRDEFVSGVESMKHNLNSLDANLIQIAVNVYRQLNQSHMLALLPDFFI